MAGTISSVGIGTSGLDVSSIITKLVALEKAPLTDLKAKATVITTKISAYSQIKSLASTLSDTAFNLSLSTTWKAVATTSSNTSAVQAANSGTSIAATGSFSVKVQQLAKAQSGATDALGATDAVGAGNLRIQLGTWASNSFTAGAAPEVAVAVTATDTISDVAAKINAAGAGVTATVLTDTTGQRLLIRSNTTGEATGYRIQADETVDDADTSTGLSRLAFDPQAGAFGMASASNVASVQYGQNAKATVNNIAVTSTTNTFTDTVPGLTFTVAQETTTAVDITVASDQSAMGSAIQKFVDAYNALQKFIGENTAYDASEKTGSVLQGDSTAVGIQTMLRNLVGSVTTGGAYQRLSDIGVEIQQDGTLAIATDKGTAALADVAAITNLFTANTGTGVSTNGFGVKLKAFMTGMLNTGGTIGTRTSSLQTEQKSNSDAQTKVNDHADLVEARLQKTYTALDAKMASLSALNAYITQQVAQWNKSTG